MYVQAEDRQPYSTVLKNGDGTRAVTNSRQLQNSCPLFIQQSQDNFMQAVFITSNGMILRAFTDKFYKKDVKAFYNCPSLCAK